MSSRLFDHGDNPRPPLKNVVGGPEVSIYGHVSSEQTLKNRRERIATAVLAGLATKYEPRYACKLALECTDALIAELDKK